MVETSKTYDVVVVGGGVAGLSGTLVLCRARRSVLVVDSGEQRNSAARAVHGFFGRDGVAPGELVQMGAAEVRRYGGEITRGHAISASSGPAGLALALADGRVVHGRRLLPATGLVDELPDIAGVRERWGRDVFHCPYCHGWEVHDQAVGILATNEDAIQESLLLRQWSDDVTVFLHTSAELTSRQREHLLARDVRMVGGAVQSLIVRDDRLAGVRLRDATVVQIQALVVAPIAAPRRELLLSLGIEAEVESLGSATDPTGRTQVDGVWVAGNVADETAQVIDAASSGSRAAVSINADLVIEDV